jgi:hypothetical protein
VSRSPMALRSPRRKRNDSSTSRSPTRRISSR